MKGKALSSQEIAAAKLSRLQIRKALEDYDALEGWGSTVEHRRLGKAFDKATQEYLRLSDAHNKYPSQKRENEKIPM